MVIISARGGAGFEPGGQFAAMNHQPPYLATIFGFRGITDITFISMENDEIGGQPLADAIAQARLQIAQRVRE